jgi:hypothetical protein
MQTTPTSTNLFESEDGYFSKEGNSLGIRTGWKLTRLGQDKKMIILKQLERTTVDKVFRDQKDRKKVYGILLNGHEFRIF